jgi:hypothetical protein
MAPTGSGGSVVLGADVRVSCVCGVTIMSSGGDLRCPVVGVCIVAVWLRVGVDSVVVKCASVWARGMMSVWVGWMVGRWCWKSWS